MQSTNYETYFALCKLLLIISQSLLGINSSLVEVGGIHADNAWKHMTALTAWPDALPTSFRGFLFLGCFLYLWQL